MTDLGHHDQELSQLCHSCMEFFTSQEHSPYRTHAEKGYSRSENVTKIRANAAAGCAFCSWLERKCHYENGEMDAELSRTWETWCLPSRYDISTAASVSYSFYIRLSHGPRFHFQMVPLEQVCPLPQYHQPLVMTALETNDSPTSAELAHLWLSDCQSSHDICKTKANQSAWCPSRLLELDIRESEHPSIRVIDRSQIGPDQLYVALSHCWGSSTILTLNSETSAELRQGVPISKLPRTFRDAVRVCRWSGHRYLWIDSLCIMQSSRADWVTESHTMAKVYSNAQFTIAAAGSSDSDGGLFATRRPGSVIAPVVQTAWEGIPNSRFCLLDSYLWYSQVDNSALSSRAWALQERLLSPRILFFANSQMFFKCYHTARCETFPFTDIPSQFGNSTMGTELETASPAEVWNSAAEAYSSALLSRDADKVVAIAGIAERVRQMLGDEYIVGLWKGNMEMELVWGCPDMRNQKRASPKVAPSWSWLCLNGRIKRAASDQVMIASLIELTDISANLLDRMVPTGNITSASLRLRGILKPATWDIDTVRDEEVHERYGVLYDVPDGSVACDCTAYLDVLPTAEMLQREIMLLPVVVSAYSYYVTQEEQRVTGLILISVDASMDMFERIGSFEIPLGESQFLFHRRAQQGQHAEDLWHRLQGFADLSLDDDDGAWEPIPAQEIAIV